MALGLWDVIWEAGRYWEDGRFRVDFWNTERDRKERAFRFRLAHQHEASAYSGGWWDGEEAGRKEGPRAHGTAEG